ncbi:GNAT family N-acetyltransferase [Bacillus sp. 31A1R]|uniref:GNAT family N-acetyltransferase n=1 Tax=Robertmurraya mangrovi TaxID=3098077 RepID=A0ABU5IVR9_9BACI|nr:GNAT family N-acetyltransferase [Bacillus sp. 31A1R]MDZ5471253.1 GNAT family N-acetyltransferase [Bacillus sp. 31A1R]
MDFLIRDYRETDHNEVVELYKAIKSKYKDIIFWWPGPIQFAPFTQSVFVNERMVAKGQVQPITIIKEDGDPSSHHEIYVNMKIHPDYEENQEIRDSLYEILYEKALKIKGNLPESFQTKLCAGNYAIEVADNQFLMGKGFEEKGSLYWMVRDLTEMIEPVENNDEEIEIKEWKIETEEEIQYYLKMEKKIWPDHPISKERLLEYKCNPNWTCFAAFVEGELVASVMAWQESDTLGEIEDLFVSPDYRNRGLARVLFTKAMEHLSRLELKEADLCVLVDNDKAINLYRSVGFQVAKEEKRFKKDLIF